MDPAFAKASLADLTRSCFEGARQSIQRLEGKDKIYMQTRLADLRLWADSVGATAQAKASLDQRFQHRPADLYFIRGLLFMLQGFFSECSIAADNKSDTTDIISNINSTIDSLAILGVQIRRSGRKSRLEKADGSFDGNREKYRTFRAHLACIIVSRPTENGRPENEGREIHSVDYFANLKLTSIQERLIEANLRRRHRFLEAQRHSRGLEDAHGLENAYGLEDLSITPQQTITETPSSHAKQGANSTSARNVAATMQALLRGPRHGAPLTTVTSASGLDSKWGGLRDSRRPSSTATRITTITAAARYPKAHAPSEQKLIKCPCCCQAIPASEAEASQWKKHLANDINPYTCILENCPKPYNLFATQNEWKDHFTNDHPSQWYCPCCASNAPVFKSLSGVINHIMSRHPDAISDNLEDLLSDAEIKVMGITKCPLCDSEGPPDSPELVEHVLQHVHDFSLRSLPWPTDLPFSPSNPVATFNTDYATRPHKDDSGNKYSFSVAEWAESVAPKKGASGEISVVDSEGNELALDMTKYPKNTTPSDGPWLQLCNLDCNPPNISEVESPSIAQFNLDYFSGNLYFKEDSSDSWSSSQSRQSSRQTQNTSVMKKWACTLCDSQSGQGDDAYFRHLEGTHYKDIVELEDCDIDIEEWMESMLDESYENAMHAISIAGSSSISLRSRPLSPAISEEYEESETTYRQEPELREQALGREHPDTPNKAKTRDDWFVIFNRYVPRVLDVNLIHTLPHESVVCSVRFSHDGKYLATGCNHLTQIYEVSNGGRVYVLQDENMDVTDAMYIRSVCFSPDGKYLVTGAEDKLLRVWDVANRTLQGTLAGHEDDITSLDIARDGRTIVSGGSDRTVRLWDIESGTNILTLVTEEGVVSVAISPDIKYVASGCLDNVVRVWDTEGHQLQHLKGSDGHEDSVYSVAFSPRGNQLMSGSLDKTIKIWDLPPSSPSPPGNAAPKEGRCIRTFVSHRDFVLSVAFTPDARWVISGSKDRGVQFWDPHTGYTQLMLQGHTNSVISVAASPTGGFFATGSGDQRVRIWSYRSIAQ
ncbi:putative WD domain-containing protein [Rosellinia necatrix]|uniref:Putative WD domain-containing protein n=1 Tax=Rosellinia necatrix TaxID=77044 RepID=A0A1W2TVF0_ROSNE|nr:putative WD domain-containing protein [Rosellinia necatrix]